LAGPYAFGQVNVLTQHNDNARTGSTVDETILNTSNVNVNEFGKLLSVGVDGQVYAQPLYVSNVSIGGGTHNVVYVATENNSVYAFDADSGATYWHKNFGTPFSSTCSDLSPVVGITGTPVIDLSSSTLYVDSKLASGPSHKLHALSIIDGSEKFGGPVTISASSFSASIQHQRPGLLLLNGVVYLAFGSHCDGGAYHGFLMAFDAGTLSHLHTLNTTPTGSQGSIWQSGMGPAADGAGNIYVITGNGSWDGSSNFGESYLKLSGTLSVLDFFTPSNWASLNSGDTDLGAGGAVLVPSHFIVGLGKDGNLHLVDQNSMGHLGGGVQSFSAASGGDTVGMSPIYWQGPSKQYIFVGHSNSPTKSFEFTGSSINTTPLGTNSVTQNDRAGGMSLSANGTTAGILWTIGTDSKVRAYDAVNFPTLLWDSGQNSSRDAMGTYVKFVAPTIANGKVYVATQNSLVVYGLLSGGGPPPAPTNLTATAGNAQVSLSWNASSGATSYHVKRATVSGGPYTTVGSPTSTSFTDTGLTNGTTYFYVVTAVNSAGESGNSNQVSATPTSGGGTVNAISINFVGNGVTPMGGSESAGVVPKTNWNNAAGASGSGQVLKDETGTSTSARLTWAANHLTASGITDTAGNFRMMKGSVNTSNTSTTTITVSGLTSHTYDVYLYFNENTFGASRTSAYTISGTGITTTTIKGIDNAQFNGTFTQANNSVGNYVKFTITAAGFTVTAKPVSSTDSNLRAPVNGIQIIPR
jgi:outer membrane protein assembly factor BamB